MAAWNGPSRLQFAGAFCIDLRCIRQFGAPAGHDPSCTVRITRTVLRGFNRTFCGKFPSLACPGTGSRPSDLRKAPGIWPLDPEAAFRSRDAGDDGVNFG